MLKIKRTSPTRSVNRSCQPLAYGSPRFETRTAAAATRDPFVIFERKRPLAPSLPLRPEAKKLDPPPRAVVVWLYAVVCGVRSVECVACV